MPGPRDKASAERYAAIHRALLTGLLSNMGHRGEGRGYVGARGRKFSIFPGSALFRRNPSWVVAAELVETTRLYARTVAGVHPDWVERAAEHLVRRAYSEPHWQQETGYVKAFEKVTLWGLVLTPRRLVHYGPIDPVVSRELFVRHALVEGEYRSHAPFFRHNQELVRQVRAMEEKARRRDLLADAAVRYAFFDQRVPPGIYNGPLFEKWRRHAEQATPRLLFLEREDVQTKAAEAITPERFPDRMAVGDLSLALAYRYEVGHPADGVTVTIPLAALNQVPAEPFEWLVPGMLREKIAELIRTLPKHLRVHFIPVPDVAAEAEAALAPGEGSLTRALALFLGKRSGLPVPAGALEPETLPDHLRMRFRVVDAAGKTLAGGCDLNQIRRDLDVEVRDSFARLPPSEYNRGTVTRWDFGDLPQRVEVQRHGMTLWGYPALVDEGATAALRLLDSAEAARDAMRAGARKLFMVQLKSELQHLGRTLPGMERMCLNFATAGSCADLKEDLLTAIADRALYQDDEQIRRQAEFVGRAEAGWRRLSAAAVEVADLAGQILAAYQEVLRALSRTFPPLAQAAAADMRDQLARLVYNGFLTETPHPWLRHLPRYVRAIGVRVEKLMNAGLARDAQAAADVMPLWEAYKARAFEHRRQGIRDPALEQYRWMLEELRVSLFAQELKTAIPVSMQRLRKQWEQVRPGR